VLIENPSLYNHLTAKNLSVPEIYGIESWAVEGPENCSLVLGNKRCKNFHWHEATAIACTGFVQNLSC
jgi:hypothetical protein